MNCSRSLIITIALFITFHAHAGEGMWLLTQLEGYTIEDMQSKGFRLDAEDIYSINQACLKDAVVIFGGGCTGEMVSGDGLVLTNHHCGYGTIQSHSSVENDYLRNGYWAMSREEELPNPGLAVRFLRYMKEVTDEVLMGSEGANTEEQAAAIKRKNAERILDEAMEEGKYEADVEPVFYGNQYFLFVYERYNDVRLVGAPPNSIGNFGEDTDNWVWPRHTGDFAIFRIYADKDNQPADYSEENIPYKPRKFLEISLEGVEQGDFTMILGYPGSTDQFLYSRAISTLMEETLPLCIDLRTQRLEIMDKYIKQSEAVWIQYASKYRNVSNAWKKWQGEISGLERLDAVNRKIIFENEFTDWVQQSGHRTEKYGTILEDFEKVYNDLSAYDALRVVGNEALMAVELIQFAASVNSMMSDTLDPEVLDRRVRAFYKDFNADIDREIFAAMMKTFTRVTDEIYTPDLLKKTEKKYHGDFKKYADRVYGNTPLRSLESMLELAGIYETNQAKALKILEKDPLLQIYEQFIDIYMFRVRPELTRLYLTREKLYKLWVQGIFEMNSEVRHYPDANFTMRLSYGEIDGYQPEDAVYYSYQTDLSGIIEKNNLGYYDYDIPEKLLELYEAGDFGIYGNHGTMPVCFAASNHTSGGNSGSPVLNADGRLIGINFDRNWHGAMSDEMYDPEMCRNISVDVRYILFIVDKFAGAGYLLDEMTIVYAK